VAAAIAVHGRATGVNHARVLEHWLERVRTRQIDSKSGFVFQRMSAGPSGVMELGRAGILIGCRPRRRYLEQRGASPTSSADAQ
jgi:hypothetical protein